MLRSTISSEYESTCTGLHYLRSSGLSLLVRSDYAIQPAVDWPLPNVEALSLHT
jgi:hypothetical protein